MRSLKIDMTPMVDLGFLLITFFVFTTSLSTPSALSLYMPKTDTADSSALRESLALTALLDDDNRIFYYHGQWGDAEKKDQVFETSFSVYSGLGEIIRQKQKILDGSKIFPEGRKGLVLIIKPTSASAYKNMVDALDEALINDVKKYTVLDPAPEETAYIKRKF